MNYQEMTNWQIAIIIILISAILVIYCNTQLNSKYITYIKEKSLTEVMFFIIFFILLYIPIFHINTAEFSFAENRKLAKFPNITKENNKINFNFGNEFDNWFSDRFFLKDNLISFFNNCKYKLSSDYVTLSNECIYKKSDWMFENTYHTSKNTVFKELSKKDLEKYTHNIKLLLDYCKEKNIKLYIVVIPSKEFVYREFDKANTKNTKEKTVKLVQKIKKELDFDILYPVEELEKIKNKEFLYYKTDMHMTDSGTYIVYTQLLKAIQQDFKDIEITDLNEFNVTYDNLTRSHFTRVMELGSNYVFSRLNDRSVFKTKYKFLDYKNIETTNIQGKETYSKHFNKNKKYSMFIIGNSFCENLTYFLNTSFRNIEKYRFNTGLDLPKRKEELEMEAYYPLIEKEKPEILLLVFSTGWLNRIENMYKEGNN